MGYLFFVESEVLEVGMCSVMVSLSGNNQNQKRRRICSRTIS